jgi:hypothetical protein
VGCCIASRDGIATARRLADGSISTFALGAIGLVMPSVVRVPVTSVVRGSSFSTCVEVKLSVGKFATSDRTALFYKFVEGPKTDIDGAESTVKLVKLCVKEHSRLVSSKLPPTPPQTPFRANTN